MSPPTATTVVASRHGSSLVLLPAAAAALDISALRRVLARHGLRLVEGSDLLRAPEFIAAEGLSAVDAAALADDLRGVGLTARVVNRDGLTESRRVGNALATLLMVGIFSFGAAMTGFAPLIDGVHDGAPLPAWAAVISLVGVVGMLWAGLNALSLQRAGGTALRVAGAPSQGTLSEQITALAAQLPDHLARDMLARTRRLEANARQDPEGQAARELRGLLAELRGESDAQVAEDAEALREDVARARRALAETHQQ